MEITQFRNSELEKIWQNVLEDIKIYRRVLYEVLKNTHLFSRNDGKLLIAPLGSKARRFVVGNREMVNIIYNTLESHIGHRRFFIWFGKGDKQASKTIV